VPQDAECSSSLEYISGLGVLPSAEAAALVRRDGEFGLDCLRGAIREVPSARSRALRIIVELGPYACEALPEVMFALVLPLIAEDAVEALRALGPCASPAAPILEAYLETNRRYPERLRRIQAALDAITAAE